MPYTVNVTRSHSTSVTFDTKDEAQNFIEEPDYSRCCNWTTASSKFDLVETPGE
jgi:hypothetical protein